MITRNFYANKTSAEFMKDQTSYVKMLFGCVGSGKSSTCCVEIMQMARNMPPGNDGIRRSKWAIIRSTYSQLKTTALRTWLMWFPPENFGQPKGDSPITHKICMNDEKGRFELEVVFLAIENLNDIDRLKSFEFTGAYINEAQFFDDQLILTKILERTNRYPQSVLGGSLQRPIVLLDCNPPSDEHWIYRVFEVERPEGFKIFKMPPALIKDNDGKWINNPDADFIKQHEDQGYWLKLAAASGFNEEYIRVDLCGGYGRSEGGRPVHPEYNDALHYKDSRLQYDDTLPIGLGWDFGLTPACAIVQLNSIGQLVVLDELFSDNSDLRTFLEDSCIPYLDRNYNGWRKDYDSVHDPSGNNRSQSDATTCKQILHYFGIISSPCIKNDRTFRGDALKYFLRKLSHGQPGFLLSNRCERLRSGLRGKFKYEKIKSVSLTGEEQYREKPLKNKYSHICEALEYISTHYSLHKKENKADNLFKPYKMYTGSSFMGM